MQDSIALVSLYDSTGGPLWNNAIKKWGSGPINNWYGVTLNSSKRVYRLNLSNNGLDGNMPDSIGKLKSLDWLYLSGNDLSGSIPDSIGCLTNLTILDLSDNQLSGVIPYQLENNTKLTSISLDNNMLSGDFPDVSEITGLNFLSITGNRFTFKNLESSGILPGDIDVFQYSPQDTILTITHNLSNWTISVEVEDNPENNYSWYKDGSPISEAARTFIPPSEGLYNCEITNADFPGLTLYSDTLDFQYSYQSDSIALLALFNATNGTEWSNNTNWLASDTDLSEWYGITLDGEQRVSEIDLSGNLLKGTLPSEIANLSHLVSLKVSVNQLAGNLPPLEGIETIDTIKVEHNLFDFIDLSSSQINPDSINSFIYEPQDTIPRLNFNHYDVTLTVDVGIDPNNIYTWFKGGAEIDDSLRTIVVSEEGSFNCEVTNSTFTALTLYSDTSEISFSLASDSISLVHLYNETDGIHWKTRTNWLTGRVSTWYGITVTGNRVSRVLLSNNGLTGIIPSQIGNLTHLTQLNLSNNQLSGSIPFEIGNLTLLTSLKLNSNQLTGNIPPDIWNHDVLTSLNLEFNQLTGTIPVEIGNLTGLTSLKLSNNELTGEIPVEIGDLINLTWLSLSNNQLTGAIPTEIENLTDLTGIELGGNKLTGNIPLELCGITGLIQLSLNGNQLSGTIPSEMEQLTHLNYLSLGDNQLTGTIPAGIGELSGLTDLLLQNNQLSDTIPSEIGYLTSLTNLNLRGNKLIGSIPPEIEYLTSLISLNLDSNQFVGDLPLLSNATFLSELSVNNNQFTFSNLLSSEILPEDIGHFLYAPQDTILGLEYALASGTLTVLDDGEPENAFSWYKDSIQLNETTDTLTMKGEGSYNCEVVNPLFPDLVLYSDTFIYSYSTATDSITLVTLYDETDGANWNSNDNWKTDPLSSWSGVTLDGSHRVSQLRLNGNHLTGILPSEIGNLTHLTLLYLHNNTLSGSIPSEISELENLIDLRMNNNQLSGSIPAGIGGLTSLTTLYLNYNQLSGAIPIEIGELTDLTYLSLNNNQLTDPIPAEIGNLTLLQTLNLSQNQLSGNIPSEMGDMGSLQYLYLSNNQLTGSVPTSFGDLSIIRTLNISGNDLSGSIPAEIENLDDLSTLNIANNNFHFRTIEPIFGWINYPGFSSFTYSPQKKIGLTQTIPGYIGYPLTIEIDGYITGGHDAFKWYKNDILQVGKTDSVFTIPGFAESDTAIYHCVITNSAAPLLTLTSNDITVESVGLVITAGGLAAALTPEEKDTITRLTLIGTIDARDFKTMRDDMPLLAELDLSRVTVVAYEGSEGTSMWGYANYPADAIPEFAFCNSNWEGKTSLTSIILPSATNTIGRYSFYGCSGLTVVSIPSLVATIRDYAFYNCSEITVVSLPSLVTTIGYRAFENCSGLTSLTLPSSVTDIGEYAFRNSSGFITVEESNLNFSSADGVLFNESKTSLIQCPTSKTGSYFIPASVNTIVKYAFFNCSNLTSITIPSSVTSIEQYALENCSGLTSIYAKSITPINLMNSWGVFNNINKTTCILHVPYGTSALYASAYRWQDFINIVEDPNGFLLSSFRINFTSSGGDGSINIHANVDWTASYNQGWYTLAPTSGNSDNTLSYTASANTASIIRTDTVTISSSGQASQKIVVFQEALPKSVGITPGGLAAALTTDEKNSIHDLTLTGNIDARDFKTMRDSMPLLAELDLRWATIVAYNGLDGTSIWGNTSYSANAIPESAFMYAGEQGKTSLHSILLPATLTLIERYAFGRCSGLTGSLTIPNTVTLIGDNAFESCRFNGTLTIPNSVTTIGNSAFYNCNGFSGSLTIGNSVTSIGYSAFNSCYGFTGSLAIGNSVTSIGAGAFNSCFGFTGSLAIGNSVTSIGDYAFYNCHGFTGSLTIPNSVVSIGNSAFSYCSGFTGSLTIPNSITSLNDWIFGGCNGLTGSLVIPNSVTSIGNYAFIGCHRLSGSLTIPNSVSSIGNNAFQDCFGFTGNLMLPNSVTSIGDGAFWNCNGFTGGLAIPNSVTLIENGTFYNCSGLTTLNIPSTVTSIEGNAFQNCSDLNSIYSHTNIPVDLSSSPNVFNGVDTTNCTLYVPDGTSALYAAANQWQDFIHIVEMPENDVEINNSVTGMETTCFDALNTITVAGGGHTVIFESGSEVTLIAGHSIRFLPGFHAYSGSFVDAHITTTASFCEPPELIMTPVVTTEKSVVDLNINVPAISGKTEKLAKIFPNPNNGKFAIEFSNFENPVKVSVINLTGAIIYPSQWINSGIYEMNLQGIDKGIYFVRIEDGKTLLSKKIVVQ